MNVRGDVVRGRCLGGYVSSGSRCQWAANVLYMLCTAVVIWAVGQQGGRRQSDDAVTG